MSQEKSHTVNATGRKAAHTGHMTKRHLPQGHVYSRVPNKRTPPPRVNILARSDPPGVEKFTLPKNREEIQLQAKKKSLKTSLFLRNLAYFSLFSCHFCSM